ncbi:MAG: dTDP-4-dehydrorhamnose reductase [Acidimicrobiia bacterium]|nr:MAG: dTDP-4-dehydrorhamnose reductase [Acidimicrobiia bacterium]
MIVVTGTDGQLGTGFKKILAHDVVFLTRTELDLADIERIGPTLAALQPSTVINCAAYTAVDGAETEEDTAKTINGHAVNELATVCRETGARFVTFSTDYVFDGTKAGGYVESDTPNPISAYGRSKLLGERLAFGANPDALIIRTSWLLSGTHPNFALTMLRLLAKGDVSVVNDQFGRPTLVDDLAPATLKAMDDGLTGVLHLANVGVTTWFDLARQVADIAGLDSGRVHPCSTSQYPTPAARPLNSVLDSERLSNPMPPYEASLESAVRSLLHNDRTEEPKRSVPLSRGTAEERSSDAGGSGGHGDL